MFGPDYELTGQKTHCVMPFSRGFGVDRVVLLTKLAGTPVKFRFHLRAGSIYSFWVNPDQSGASHGYVAAGGPGFTGPLDTVGSAIYEHCCATEELH
jgi:hypothetical protein